MPLSKNLRFLHLLEVDDGICLSHLDNENASVPLKSKKSHLCSTGIIVITISVNFKEIHFFFPLVNYFCRHQYSAGIE